MIRKEDYLGVFELIVDTLTGVPEFFKGYLGAYRQARVSHFALLSLGNYVLMSDVLTYPFTLVALHVTQQIWGDHL